MLAALPPIAGSTPISTPMNAYHSSWNGRDRISQITFTCRTARFAARSTAAIGVPVPRSSSDMICANANTPISTGRKSMPPRRNGMPSVSRSCPITGSLPRMVTMQPSAPEIRPFTRDASTRPATIDSARMNREKNSHGPNCSAMRASGPVAAMRNTPPSRPPKKDAHTPSQIARPDSPLRDIGWPSKVVAIAEGVPGMPSSTAVTRPPAEPPT